MKICLYFSAGAAATDGGGLGTNPPGTKTTARISGSF